MDITIGNMELVRTDPAHIGSGPLLDTNKTVYRSPDGSLSNSAPVEKEKGTFESYLLEAMSSVNKDQLDYSALAKQAIVDPENVNPEAITGAMAKAQMTLTLAQTVIDRVISGWNELSQSR